MIIYLSLLVCLVGLVIYVTATTNGKVVEIGHIMFWTGLLAFLLIVPGHEFAILGR